MSPLKMFQIITLGVPEDLPVREQVAASSLHTLTQLTACLASIVNLRLQSGKDQILKSRSKHPVTITSFDVSKSDTKIERRMRKICLFSLVQKCIQSAVWNFHIHKEKTFFTLTVFENQRKSLILQHCERSEQRLQCYQTCKLQRNKNWRKTPKLRKINETFLDDFQTMCYLLPHSFSWAKKCFLICIVLMSIKAIVPSIDPVTT